MSYAKNLRSRIWANKHYPYVATKAKPLVAEIRYMFQHGLPDGWGEKL
jgi:hypothetical protein